jgi:ketosteroid isomerase-like protein
VYGEDAAYLGPRGDTVRGRAAIREEFAGLFERANEQGDELTLTFEHVERAIEGRLAYETGYYTLTRRGPEGERSSRGKFVVVARFTKGKGWSFQVDSYSPAP